MHITPRNIARAIPWQWVCENCSINKLTHFTALDVGDCRRICDYWALFNMKRYGVIKNALRVGCWRGDIEDTMEHTPKGNVKIQIYRRIREGNYLIRYVGYKKIASKLRENMPRKSKGNSQYLRRYVNTQFNKFTFYWKKNQTSVTCISRDQI